MRQEYTYLWINFLTILFPLIFSFHPKIRFYRKWKILVPGMLIVATFFIVWDMIFTSMGVWRFNPNMITGIKIGNLPMEEFLFFFTIPYSCVFLYEAINTVIKKEKFQVVGNIIFYLLLFTLLSIAIFNTEKIYTLITFLFLVLYLLLTKFIIKADYWNVAIISYLILLIPFFLVNGYLTGMFTEEAVVLYNNEENLGIRMITIPIEDTFYGLLLFMLNISFFEYFRKSFVSKPKVLFG